MAKIETETGLKKVEVPNTEREYLGKVHIEVKHRPLWVVHQTAGFPPEQDPLTLEGSRQQPASGRVDGHADREAIRDLLRMIEQNWPRAGRSRHDTAATYT